MILVIAIDAIGRDLDAVMLDDDTDGAVFRSIQDLLVIIEYLLYRVDIGTSCYIVIICRAF